MVSKSCKDGFCFTRDARQSVYSQLYRLVFLSRLDIACAQYSERYVYISACQEYQSGLVLVVDFSWFIRDVHTQI